MECTRIMVAFIDEKQRLRKAEEGTVDYFTQCAVKVGIKPENIHGPINLTAQFRCAGSNEFILALDRAFYDEAPAGFSNGSFSVQIHDSIQQLEDYLQSEIDAGYKARIVAGFCWEWSDPKKDGSLRSDVVVKEWARPWNRKAQNRKYPAAQHPYTIWANRIIDQLAEAGCIYSAQGFEFDFIGVIWGPDLVWRKNTWVPHPEKSFDIEMKQRNRVTPAEVALPLLKNAYRVLCSRGIRGCSIFCPDEETSEYLRRAFRE